MKMRNRFASLDDLRMMFDKGMLSTDGVTIPVSKEEYDWYLQQVSPKSKETAEKSGHASYRHHMLVVRE